MISLFLGTCSLKRNQLLDIISKRSKGYTVTFDIKPISVVPTWTNILHFTITGNRGNFGDRAPGVWFLKNSTRLYICSDFHASANKCSVSKSPLKLGEYTSVEIKQYDLGYSYWIYRSKINGIFNHNWANFKPRCFMDVKLYASNPWYSAADAVIKNLKYTDTISGKSALYCN